MIPGSLFSGEFTLGLIAQIRIWFCWKGLQQRLQVAVLSLAQPLSWSSGKIGSDYSCSMFASASCSAASAEALPSVAI